MRSESLVPLALYSALAVGVLTVLLLLQVLLITTLNRRRTRERTRLEAGWRPWLAKVAAGDRIDRLPLLPPAYSAWFLVLWCRTQRSLRGETRRRLNTLLYHLGLDRFALGIIAGGRAQQQLIGLTTLGYLGNLAHWPEVAARLADLRPIIALAAARTLVSLDPARAMDQLMLPMLTRRDWSRAQVATLCRAAGQEAVTPPLLDAVRRYQGGEPVAGAPLAVARLMALLPLGRPAELAPFARRLLADADPRVACAALGCLADNADPRDRPAILAMLSHPDAEARAMAVRALAPVGEAADLRLLLPMLADTDWWIRQQAARTMAQMPGLGRSQLERLLAEVRDPYGREALAYALRVRGL
ncbi:HEAT repeat domain-containing protein [Zobellella iuensis]|uniref:HEAT repeat domain-containing protein n=1 Tax=Zobellella iuensis TaxID=2803811 RepID=A0ABS1QMW4_9GAMM|nr:HEAT repeat domain-containing protein [Zobellella iuensis]MBL1376197.1 HEAT repeat domain-containing protein [Zobellella iuensis]